MEYQEKRFVNVVCEHRTDGSLHPLTFCLDDYDPIEIDRVTDVRRAASLKCGGQGMRYTCRVQDHLVYLFHDRNLWFIETQEV